MAIPEQIDPVGLSDYLEIMSRAIFQAGMSWALIERKWEAFRRVFYGFDPVRIAAMSEADISWLCEEPDIIRSRKKIAGTVENARAMLALEREHGSFRTYLRSFRSYEERSADLRKRFAFLGELSVYYLLFRVKEPVPNFEDWSATVPGNHPRMKEMVELGRSRGTSTEMTASGAGTAAGGR